MKYIDVVHMVKTADAIRRDPNDPRYAQADPYVGAANTFWSNFGPMRYVWGPGYTNFRRGMQRGFMLSQPWAVQWGMNVPFTVQRANEVARGQHNPTGDANIVQQWDDSYVNGANTWAKRTGRAGDKIYDWSNKMLDRAGFAYDPGWAEQHPVQRDVAEGLGFLANAVVMDKGMGMLTKGSSKAPKFLRTGLNVVKSAPDAWDTLAMRGVRAVNRGNRMLNKGTKMYEAAKWPVIQPIKNFIMNKWRHMPGMLRKPMRVGDMPMNTPMKPSTEQKNIV